MQRKAKVFVAMLALVALSLPIAHAATVRRMDLAEMCNRADRIFKGRVVSIDSISIEAGGSELPAVTYLMEVTDPIQGEFEKSKGTVFTSVTMLRGSKDAQVGDYKRFGKSLELPQLAQGDEYLLVLTPESSIGLTMTVGIGQGCFSVVDNEKGQIAANELGNAGLSATIDEPVGYDHLAGEIRALIGK